MSARAWIFGVSALVVAFSSMAYELTLAQSITVIYGDTITSYSMVIGCFVLSLGLGSAYWAKASRLPTVQVFWLIEMILATLGAVAPFVIFRVEFGGSTGIPWGMVTGLGLALVIGLFAGMEIPLLIALASPKSEIEFKATRLVIGLDFMGTFLASLVVPLWLFVSIGLVGVPFVGGLFNILLGIVALAFGGRQGLLPRLLVTGAIAAVLIGGLYQVEALESYLSRGVF